MSFSDPSANEVLPDGRGQGNLWGYLVTQVADSGLGIEPSMLRKLFSTFS